MVVNQGKLQLILDMKLSCTAVIFVVKALEKRRLSLSTGLLTLMTRNLNVVIVEQDLAFLLIFEGIRKRLSLRMVVQRIAAVCASKSSALENSLVDTLSPCTRSFLVQFAISLLLGKIIWSDMCSIGRL